MKALQVLRVAYANNPPALALADAVDVPLLAPESANLLLRVLACSLNPGDVKVLAGARSLPYLPGIEVCGIVEAMGAKAAAAGAFKVGDRVAAAVRPLPSTGGGLAQFVVVEAALSAVVPPSLSPALAAAVPLAGVSALHVLKETAIGKDARVLVLGAASSVGRMVVQLAKHAGAAFVAGTAPRKELVAELPLNLVIDDHGAIKWSDQLRDRRVDVVVDCVGEPCGWRDAEKVLVPSARSVFAVLVGDMVADGDAKGAAQLITLGFVSMWKTFWRSPTIKIVGQFPTSATLREALALAEFTELAPTLHDGAPLPFTVDALGHAIALLKNREANGKIVFQVGVE